MPHGLFSLSLSQLPSLRSRTNVLQPILGTPQEFAAYLSAESRKWQRAIKDANIKLE
jgi:tripartite-type tricarboxylate transporter receptor subunit TctC